MGQQQENPAEERSCPARRRRDEVGVFWDYENLPLPSGTDVPKACQQIVKTISQRFGQIRDQRLYFDFGDNVPQNSTNSSWSALDSVFDLVNTPKRHRGHKETLDKKLISDVWAFAWDVALRSSSSSGGGGNYNDNDNASPSPGCSIVLLSSDGDYAHTLNKLRNRGIHCVVVHGAVGSVSAMLKASADVVLSLHDDILCPRPDATAVMAEQKRGTVEPVHRTAGPAPIVHLEAKTHKSERVQHVEQHSAINANIGLDPTNEVQGKRRIHHAIALCKALQTLSCRRGDAASSWVSGVRASAQFDAEIGQWVNPDERLHRFRAARDLAERLGWIEHGYRLLLSVDEGKTSHKKIIATSLAIDGNPRFQTAKRGEDCLRLTARGGLISTADFAPAALKSTCVFIKNVAVRASLDDLVQHLERHVGVRVVLAQIKAAPSPSFWFARIMVSTAAEVKALLLQPPSSMMLYDRRLEVFRDDYSVSILESIGILNSCPDAPSCPLAATTTTTAPDGSPSKDSLVVVADVDLDDATLIYDICNNDDARCVSRDAHSRWIDGVELGVSFKAALGASQSTKARFRKAYREAWNRGMIELGRQRTEKHEKIIDTVSPDDRLTGYDPGLFIRVSSSWHGGRVQDDDDLARAKQFRAVVNRDHETSVDVAAPGIEAAAAAAAVTTTTITPSVLDDDQIERPEDHADKPSGAAAVVAAVTLSKAKEIGDDRRAKLLQERIADATSEPGGVETATAMVVTPSSAALSNDDVREPPRLVQTSSRNSSRSTTSSSLTSFLRSWLS